MNGRHIEIPSPDGGAFRAYLSTPAGVLRYARNAPPSGDGISM
ncbi:hypothetical protein [Burkholderia cenocepacia]|nr:hypothetical protein [Burkholderia cenocepacia]